MQGFLWTETMPVKLRAKPIKVSLTNFSSSTTKGFLRIKPYKVQTCRLWEFTKKGFLYIIFETFSLPFCIKFVFICTLYISKSFTIKASKESGWVTFKTYCTSKNGFEIVFCNSFRIFSFLFVLFYFILLFFWMKYILILFLKLQVSC